MDNNCVLMHRDAANCVTIVVNYLNVLFREILQMF